MRLTIDSRHAACSARFFLAVGAGSAAFALPSFLCQLRLRRAHAVRRRCRSLDLASWFYAPVVVPYFHAAGVSPGAALSVVSMFGRIARSGEHAGAALWADCALPLILAASFNGQRCMTAFVISRFAYPILPLSSRPRVGPRVLSNSVDDGCGNPQEHCRALGACRCAGVDVRNHPNETVVFQPDRGDPGERLKGYDEITGVTA